MDAVKNADSRQPARMTDAGERGLPARCIRHPAGYMRVVLAREVPFLKVRVSLTGRMPTRTDWKPALPRTRLFA